MENKNINRIYDLWLEKATADPDLKKELVSIKGNDEEILDRFYRSLEFGTAGLRGVIGAGTNRMNYYTVGRATQGLADFLNKHFENPSIAIGYDSRIKSDYFSIEAAKTLAANGIKVYLYEELEPTPCLSFAIRHFKTSSGIILTASHNPAKYNGYKCYNENGYQMTDEEASETYDFIQKVDYFTGIKTMDFDEAKKKGLIEYMGQDVIDLFLDEVIKQCVNFGICEKADLNVIYTPLNGTGNKPVRKILDRIGVKKVTVVSEQENPNGNFPTCPFPNPEIKQAFECALKLAESVKPDLLLATDPDCDRVGIAVNNGKGDFQLMTGNEVGAMLLNYLLSQKKAQGTLSESSIAVKSFVSTDLAEVIAKKYNCTFKNLLTGFKYIGELITELEKQGKASDFVMGFEESYGYLAGTHARDKDAVVASMLICEMAAYYKSRGMSLYDGLMELYDTYGVYKEIIHSITLKGIEGIENMKKIMDTLRKDAPSEIAGVKVTETRDYLEDKIVDVATGKVSPTNLPKSNVLYFTLADDTWFCVRPSGTEPKIKIYFGTKADTVENAEKKIATAQDGIMKVVNSVLGE